MPTARARGWHTLLVSGGFTVFTAHVQERLGFAETCANSLAVEAGRLTGEVLGPPENGGQIVDAQGKAAAVLRACAHAGCGPQQALVVGDGANDLQMMAQAGLSVAWRAKPVVRERAAVALDYAGLDAILNLPADGW